MDEEEGFQGDNDEGLNGYKRMNTMYREECMIANEKTSDGSPRKLPLLRF